MSGNDYNQILDKEVTEWASIVSKKAKEIRERIAVQKTMKLKPIRAELSPEQKFFLGGSPCVEEVLTKSAEFRKNVDFFLKLREMRENEMQNGQQLIENVLSKRCNDLINANIFDS